MNEHQKASPSNPRISQLYQQFKVLKEYLNSNKKVKSHLQSTPHRNQPPQLHSITPILLATPKTKKPKNKPNNLTTNSKHKSGLDKLSSNNKSQKESHHSHCSNRQELIDEYYKHYEYSIKKVLKYKEKSAKRDYKENVEREEEVIVVGKRDQAQVRKKLEFQGKQSESSGTINEISYDFSTVQYNFENSLNQMITSFETHLSTKFSIQQQRLNKINSSISKVKVSINSNSQSKQYVQNRHRQHSVDIDEFNELMSQKDNQSVCSETLDQRIQDI